MTGYSPELRAVSQGGALDLLALLVVKRPYSLLPPDRLAVMSRDTLIAALLPPLQRGRRVTRPYPEEAT